MTLADLATYIIEAAALFTACGVLFSAFGKIKTRAVDESIKKTLGPMNEALEEIKRTNKTLSDEMKLILKIQRAMTTELEREGEVNGLTQKALNELNEYLINEIND